MDVEDHRYGYFCVGNASTLNCLSGDFDYNEFAHYTLIIFYNYYVLLWLTLFFMDVIVIIMEQRYDWLCSHFIVVVDACELVY